MSALFLGVEQEENRNVLIWKFGESCLLLVIENNEEQEVEVLGSDLDVEVQNILAVAFVLKIFQNKETEEDI